MHGEEEINIVLSETFQLENMDVEENNRTGSFEVQAGGYDLSKLIHGLPFNHHFPAPPHRQDEHGTLLESDLPTIGETSAEGAGSGQPSGEITGTSSCMSFKLLCSNTWHLDIMHAKASESPDRCAHRIICSLPMHAY